MLRSEAEAEADFFPAQTVDTCSLSMMLVVSQVI